MDISSALILGTSLPEGPKAAYVLVQFDELNAWLINPCDGMFYLALPENGYQFYGATHFVFQQITLYFAFNLAFA
jgi:hypothetical protein